MKRNVVFAKCLEFAVVLVVFTTIGVDALPATAVAKDALAGRRVSARITWTELSTIWHRHLSVVHAACDPDILPAFMSATIATPLPTFPPNARSRCISVPPAFLLSATARLLAGRVRYTATRLPVAASALPR